MCPNCAFRIGPERWDAGAQNVEIPHTAWRTECDDAFHEFSVQESYEPPSEDHDPEKGEGEDAKMLGMVDGKEPVTTHEE